MSQFEVYKPHKLEPGKYEDVFIRNAPKHACFESVTNSNKGFKFQFLFVRVREVAQEELRNRLTCPMSWSRAHNDHNHQAFNLKLEDLVGEDKETFSMLTEWGTQLKEGSLKFSSDRIIKAEVESTESLKTLLDEWKSLDPMSDPKVAERKKEAEDKAKMKACQKQKRQTTTRGEGTSSTPQAQITETQSLLEQFGIEIPPGSDFEVVLRVYECASRIAEDLEGQPEIQFLKKKVKTLLAVNSDFEADLLDREDKMTCRKTVMIPNL